MNDSGEYPTVACPMPQGAIDSPPGVSQHHLDHIQKHKDRQEMATKMSNPPMRAIQAVQSGPPGTGFGQ